MLYELNQVDHFTSDAVGPPGERVFYLQARGSGDGTMVTVIVEKQQTQLLASSILEILTRVDIPTGALEVDMSLLEPFEPLWRAGRLSIGYEEDNDRIVLEVDEQVLEDDDGVPLTAPDQIRFFASREQMLSFAQHSAEVAERGRPACQFCGNPIDPEGHACPATNGHKEPTSR